MFLVFLNTAYQIVFLIFALWVAAVAVGYAVKATIDRIREPKAEPETVEIKGPALDVISDACEDICDHYCKYRDANVSDGREFPPQCDECPLNRIL